MSTPKTVLLVDDDQAILELMRDFLEDEGFCVEAASDSRKALEALERIRIDCVLLDIMMPGQSGFDLCRHIRRTSETPILFLSARDEDMDKIRGFSLGADDYIVKSATPEEVVARIKAVLRRSGRKQHEHVLDFGQLVLDLKAHEASLDGKPLSLTPKEFDILCSLAEYPRQVFTYNQLLDRFWDGVGDKHTVTVHIGRLREKVEDNPSLPKWIVNVWGVGYRFEGVRK
ncbi:response regulator transcription factor [Paenibacillus piri]|uniref:Response regulator transcription factor n=1 Tax=Paenibacillus piri TaxID=2547395 RepID=A0A4V2ZSM6_9BACL|nr:response regulator transcription factor [Paenibacillus piri]TDF93734.1 response regulator transcription factor [Paenibacillus piri]